MSLARLLNASVTGTGDHVVVLGNGVGTSQKTWQAVVDAIADRVRVVRFDHAGTPGAPAEAYSPARYTSLHPFADDIAELLEELGITDCTFVGHSVSGMLGALASLNAPRAIGYLVTIGASPRYLDDPAAGYVGGFSNEAIDGLLALVASDYQTWVGGFSPLAVGPAASPAAVEEFAATLRASRPDVAHRTLTAIFRSDVRAILPSVSVPTMVCQAANDVAVPPAVGEYIAAHIPGARLRMLDMHGHVPQLTHPAQVIDALNEVLAERGLAQTA